MKALLRIDSNLRLKKPYSRNAGDNFVRAWKELNPEGSISIREVVTSHIPHLEQEVLEKFYTAGDTSDRLKLSNQLIAELFGCDEILITVPMYNFGIPSSLKAYFDLVLRTGKTFRYDEDKAIGLLQNKKHTFSPLWVRSIYICQKTCAILTGLYIWLFSSIAPFISNIPV
ncbi:FMN-dependent NADH-azoreductase [Sphingobacterium suaedae]|uniref:FMN-dependent NADH-azoreductase n=1 Tax=Sphingobacterium suaedae TaxID=1686402 RepID=A0ABW5KLH4_9SPHI